jgi:hypothetical protein
MHQENNATQKNKFPKLAMHFCEVGVAIVLN